MPDRGKCSHRKLILQGTSPGAYQTSIQHNVGYHHLHPWVPTGLSRWSSIPYRSISRTFRSHSGLWVLLVGNRPIQRASYLYKFCIGFLLKFKHILYVSPIIIFGQMIPSHEFSVVLDVVGFFTHSIVGIYYTKNEEPSTPSDDFFHFFFGRWKNDAFYRFWSFFWVLAGFFLVERRVFAPFSAALANFAAFSIQAWRLPNRSIASVESIQMSLLSSTDLISS